MSVKALISVASIPAEIREAFIRAPETENPYEALWRDVAARVVLDSYGFTLVKNPQSREHIDAIREARRWFRKGDDAATVFDLGNMEPGTVIAAVLRDHSNGDNDAKAGHETGYQT